MYRLTINKQTPATSESNTVFDAFLTTDAKVAEVAWLYLLMRKNFPT